MEEQYKPKWVQNPILQTILLFFYNSLYNLVEFIEEARGKNEHTTKKERN